MAGRKKAYGARGYCTYCRRFYPIDFGVCPFHGIMLRAHPRGRGRFRYREKYVEVNVEASES